MTDIFQLENSIAPYVPKQFPEIYRDNGPLFVQFLQSYYEWLGLDGNVGAKAKQLMLTRDIDGTLPEFLPHFESKYMLGIPVSNFTSLGAVNTDDNVRMVIKHIKSLVESKGAIGALEILFNMLYGENVNLYRPGDDIFKPSDNTWRQGKYLEVSYSPLLVQSVGMMVTGLLSGAVAYVYNYEARNYPNNKVDYVLFIENEVGTFLVGEGLRIGDNANPVITPYIIGSLTSIKIYQGGLNFTVGDELTVIVNAVGNPMSNGAIAVVSKISPKNGIVDFNIVDGGSLYANTTTDPTGFTGQSITLTQGNTNPGAGATFTVGELSNTVLITSCNDFISTYASVVLNASAYGFPNDPSANLATTLEVAWNIKTIEVGTINTLSAINPGAGYTGPVNVSVINPVTSSLDIIGPDGLYGGRNASISGEASHGEGAITEVVVKQSGFGYSNGDNLLLQSNDNVGQFANGIAQIGSIGTSEGSWLNTNSFPDSDKYIQDSYYYQDYSYEIQSSLSKDVYENIIQNITHVSGMQMFGRVKQVQQTQMNYNASLIVNT